MASKKGKFGKKKPNLPYSINQSEAEKKKFEQWHHVEKSIRNAWAGEKPYQRPRAARDMTVCPCEECDDIEAFFGPLLSPFDASDSELFYLRAALSLLNPYYFHQFVPAFMLAALRHSDEGDLLESLLFHINVEPQKLNEPYTSDRLRLFDQPQWDAINLFFKTLLSPDDEMDWDSFLECQAKLKAAC